MPNCDFYALAPDLIEILDFVFAQPGWRLMELASQHDRSLRTFRTTRDVLEGFATFSSLSVPLHFHLYSETMEGHVGSRRVTFNPGAVPGATFRHDSQGWGLIQLYFGQLRGGRLSNCHTNHNSEQRARNWAPTYADDPEMGSVESWNWKEVSRTSSRLNRFLQRRALGKMNSRPVLPGAWEAQAKGAVQLVFP